MRWAAIPTAVMRSSALLTAGAPAAPKGAAAIMHAPSTTQTTQAMTLIGTARSAMAEMAHTVPTTKPSGLRPSFSASPLCREAAPNPLRVKCCVVDLDGVNHFYTIQGCSTLSTEGHGEYCFEACESGGEAVLRN